MNESIKVGDLVQTVRPSRCCGFAEDLGHIFVVSQITRGLRCVCGSLRSEGNAIEALYVYGADVDRLKRIPPLSELEPIHNEEKAPA